MFEHYCKKKKKSHLDYYWFVANFWPRGTKDLLDFVSPFCLPNKLVGENWKNSKNNNQILFHATSGDVYNRVCKFNSFLMCYYDFFIF